MPCTSKYTKDQIISKISANSRFPFISDAILCALHCSIGYYTEFLMPRHQKIRFASSFTRCIVSARLLNEDNLIGLYGKASQTNEKRSCVRKSWVWIWRSLNVPLKVTSVLHRMVVGSTPHLLLTLMVNEPGKKLFSWICKLSVIIRPG